VALQLGAAPARLETEPPGAQHFAVARSEPSADGGIPRRRNALIPAARRSRPTISSSASSSTSPAPRRRYGMKRWIFGGCAPSTACRSPHRSIGSTGGRQDPGRTFKIRDAGPDGRRSRHTSISRSWQTDVRAGLILVEGAVPAQGGWITCAMPSRRRWRKRRRQPAGDSFRRQRGVQPCPRPSE